MIHIPETYERISGGRIEDIHADALLLKHRKSGARIALLSCEDDNKVFNIAFRTPPADSTGVAHIIEHSVLCGSRKFPLKDPFVELVKGSLNTFLNAMTYPDKTMYPVASCNDKDFQNLMDVYLDAVFYPNIYRNDKIFRQEGWHYELENADGPLRYNGVVYNEMKGAYSSSEEVLERTMMESLFPDTPYGVESGGDPERIPDLTSEEFLNFHRKYYHPSNSYIYLYGNMDMEEKLRWLDEAYLSVFDAIRVDSGIPVQKPFAKQRKIRRSYPVLEGEPLEGNSYLARSVVTGGGLDVLENAAFSVLEYALLSSPGAPVRQALLDAGIGRDVDGSYDDGILQPAFTVIARKAKEEDADRFAQVIETTLREQAEHGLSEKALLAGINSYEFRFREADYSGYPKGLIYSINLFSSWLYDDDRPFIYLQQLSVFEELRRRIGTGYFEKLVKERILDNPHGVLVTLSPEAGLAAKKEKQTEQKLKKVLDQMPQKKREELIRETEELKAYQESRETREALETIPLLERSDISPEIPLHFSAEEKDADGTKLLFHHFDTNGIGYLTLLFDTARVPDKMIPYLGLLSTALGSMSTEQYSFSELSHEILANTGGISAGLQVYPGKDMQKPSPRMFTIRAKYLHPKRGTVYELIRQILLTTDLTDGKRLREILASTRARLQAAIPASGHTSAVRRALSYISADDAWRDRTDGIAYYQWIRDLDDRFDERRQEVTDALQKLCRIVFRPENLTVSLTSDEAGFAGCAEEVQALKQKLYRGGPAEDLPENGFAWTPRLENEGFRTPGQVQYVASVGNFLEAGYRYTGLFRILRVILNYDYLWVNLRVKGGAYGCMSGFQRNGSAYLVSYRDPHLARTLRVYRDLPEYLAGFEADEREMTKYVIGAISEMDSPLTPQAKGSVSLAAWLSGLTEEELKTERAEVLSADAAGIRSLAEIAKVPAACGAICVIGSEASLEKDRDCLKKVETLQ